MLFLINFSKIFHDIESGQELLLKCIKSLCSGITIAVFQMHEIILNCIHFSFNLLLILIKLSFD